MSTGRLVPDDTVASAPRVFLLRCVDCGRKLGRIEGEPLRYGTVRITACPACRPDKLVRASLRQEVRP